MTPHDFLLGVLDFFAILLPGAMATWLLGQYIPPAALRDALSIGSEGQLDPNGWAMVSVFLLSSYTLGHFVFMMGSHLDTTYDLWRKRTKPTNRDTTFQAAEKLHQGLNKEISGGPFTTLKWCKVYIQVKAQHARVEIDRLEADQKFFRSLVVISVAFAAHFLLREAAPVAGIAAIAMGVLSYQRYVDQRWKMTELIYATAVIVAKTTSPTAPASANQEE